MAETAPRKIVVVGGGIAGISLAHYLLRHTLPTLTERLGLQYSLALVSPSSHFYWKLAAPRALVVETSENSTEPFVAIADGFQEYDASKFTFIQGEATSLDEKARILHARLPKTHETVAVEYDSLVIATGTTSHSPLFSLSGPHTETQHELEQMQSRLRGAESILVAGGGPTGVETAGELGAMSNGPSGAKRSITLLSGGSRLLSHANPRSSATAEGMLGQLGVTVSHGVRVTSAIKRKSGQSWDITLSDKSTQTVDVYIDATGCAPNSAFLPPGWLDAKGYVKTDHSSLRVDDTVGIYALGSVTSFTNGSFFDATEPVRPLADSLRDDELAINPEASRQTQSWWESVFGRRTRTYQQKVALTQFVAVGKEGGVGELGGWRVPSALVYKAKARTLMIEKMGPIMHGQDFHRV